MASGSTRRPRQADIARLAGVSQATVSAVITNQSDLYGITEDTRERVRDAVRQLGYVPNPSARRLRGKSNQLLGVHTFEPVFPVNTSDFYHDFLVGIEEQAVEAGFDLVLFTSTEDGNGQRRIFRDGVNRLNIADGSVLLGVERGSAEVARLAESGYPFVHLGHREVPGHSIAYVGVDYNAAVASAVDQLVALRHRTIAYVAEPQSIQPMIDRRAGYFAGCAANGVTARPIEESEVADLTSEWLRALRVDGCTAMLTENVAQARKIAKLAGAEGLDVPADLSMVVLTDAPRPSQVLRRWSAIGIPRRAMGREAVRLLVRLLADDEVHDRQIFVPCSAPGAATVAPAK